jgi:hypothetical protein
MPYPDGTFTRWKPASLLARRLVDLPLTDAGDTVKRPFAKVATIHLRLFIWLLDQICGSSGLRSLLPRLSVRRHNPWRSASEASFRELRMRGDTSMELSGEALIRPLVRIP